MKPRTLGAILAGGRSTRFGSDKALAPLEGRPLILWVAEALAAQCDEILICGRELAGYRCVKDRPGPDLGPLGGLAAALHDGRARGFDQVLSAPCDTPRLPPDLSGLLAGEGAAFVGATPVIGLWPIALAETIDAFVRDDPKRSMRGWAAVAGARSIDLPTAIPNLNTAADLARL
ncbi:molybdenum cofactor guanylyltransferase [Sphingomonas bacterium]|uniref:molybdenum cofactor guanylyltransferase n=1 Tax=Sphingomonas bacterium TaxID=1895847 RepID=UPI00157672B1|nr:molybdenum cofactor guanylyltransferase [Sphingomonas bacterium]